MAYYKTRRRFQGPCHFCDTKTLPDYKDVKTLKSYMTEKGKIVSRSRSGLCMKHQRWLAKSIKQARHMALLSYVSVLS